MSAAPKLLHVASDAARFLDLLAPDGRVTFQTFDDSGRHRRELSRVLHGTLAEHASALAQLNARGAGVYWMVNGGDGRGRKAENVCRIRALFVDLDGASLDPVYAAPVQPHCILETSPGRWHAYWLITNCPLLSFRSMQKALAERFNADAKICDLPRVMRLPGFDHCKRTPYQSHLVTLCEIPPYTMSQFCVAFGFDAATEVGKTIEPPSTPRSLRKNIPEGERNSTLFSLARGLVNRGYGGPTLNDRLQRINAERCTPPLCAKEVDTIVTRAFSYGSDGFILLPHRLLDSDIWKALPPATHDVIVYAFRIYNGSNNGNIALPWSDFNDRESFSNKHTFYRHRNAALGAEILVRVSEGRSSQNGRKPDLFAIAPKWLREGSLVSKIAPSAEVEKVHSYIDKQSLASDVDAASHAQINGGKAA